MGVIGISKQKFPETLKLSDKLNYKFKIQNLCDLYMIRIIIEI